MNLLLRHDAMATAKPQIKAAISVAMKIILNKKMMKKHISPRALQFRNKITCKIYITKHYILPYPDVGKLMSKFVVTFVWLTSL